MAGSPQHFVGPLISRVYGVGMGLANLPGHSCSPGLQTGVITAKAGHIGGPNEEN